MKKYINSTLLLFALLTALIPSAQVAHAQTPPTVTVTIQGGDGMRDLYIYSAAPSNNRGDNEEIYIGEYSNEAIARGLLEFDLSGLPVNIVITSAELTMTVRTDYAANASTLNAYSMETDWSEAAATWNQRDTAVPWEIAGASGETERSVDPIGSTSVAADVSDGTPITMTLNVDVVQEWRKRNLFGVQLKTASEAEDMVEYYSADNVVEANRPKLTLEYYVSEEQPTDPGWLCVVSGNSLCQELVPIPESPFVDQLPEHQVSAITSQWRSTSRAKLLCEPYPMCINDWPIFYRVEYSVSWYTDGAPLGSEFSYSIGITIPGGNGPDAVETFCGEIEATAGTCTGVVEGIISMDMLPVNYDAGYTVDVLEGTSHPPKLLWVNSEINVYLSLTPYNQGCGADYAVPVPEYFVIDPTLETPLGVNGVPADDQIYTTITGQTYMVKVKDGPWNDGVDDRTDAVVSFDGTTWITWDEFALDAICVDVDPYSPANDENYRVIYFTATTEEFHIRVADDAGMFADNLNSNLTPYQYVIGWAYLIPTAPSCESQYSYDPLNDTVASVTVQATSDDTPANNALTEPLIGGDWYGIEVAAGTWGDGVTSNRIDMEFEFTTDGTLGGTSWADLAEGSPLVYCVSTDGLTVYVQAPAALDLTLHLRVNDQDVPQDWSDNSGALSVNIYHVAFTRILDGCEMQYEVGDLVSSGTVAGSAANGKAFGNSLVNPVLTNASYDLTPGGWYTLETTGGPWWQTYTNSTYTANRYYYDMQIRTDSGTWTTLDEWALATCVTDVDALGHKRVYFQVPNALADGTGNVFSLRVAGASPVTRGEMGWDLYQAVDLTTDDTGSCADWVYDPNVVAGIGSIDANRSDGEILNISNATPSDYVAIQIHSSKTVSDPTLYKHSGWYEQAGGTESDSMQLSSNGTTWNTLPNDPAILCYYYTPVSNELVFFVRRQTSSNTEVIWRLRANSETFSNNTGEELYSVYPSSLGDLDPWTDCASDYTATVPALNEHEWIPPQDEEGVTIMPSLTYTTSGDPDGDGIIGWGDPGLKSGHFYMVQTIQGPWKTPSASSYDAELSSDNGATWYAFGDHPDVICAAEDQIGWYWKAIFEVTDGQQWKIRVADDTVWTDNTGNLAYKLNLVNEFPTDGPGDFVTDYDPGAFDVCAQTIVRPESLTLSEIGSVGNYLSDWIHYASRSSMSYMAWCPRHTDLLISAMNALKTKEPLATVYELTTVQKNVMNEVDSYEWDGGGFQDTSIFDVQNSGDVDEIVDHFIPDTQVASPWEDGGDLITLTPDTGLPAYYYACDNAFADYLPSRLKYGVCFVSAYWKETGASFWVQLSLDISAIMLLFVMIKGSLQSLIYMMTGVRPWTKDGAIKLINNAGSAYMDEQTARINEETLRRLERRR